jgi:hypothetical protein
LPPGVIETPSSDYETKILTVILKRLGWIFDNSIHNLLKKEFFNKENKRNLKKSENKN